MYKIPVKTIIIRFFKLSSTPHTHESMWRVQMKDNGPLSEIMETINWTTGTEIIQSCINSSEMQSFAQKFQDGDSAEDHLRTIMDTPYDTFMEYQRKHSHAAISKKLLDAIPARSIVTTLLRSGRMVHWTIMVTSYKF